MNIRIKNIKHNPTQREDPLAFTANLYIDGRLAAHVSKDGGQLNYMPAGAEEAELIKKAEEFCIRLPPRAFPVMFTALPMDLKNYIHTLFHDYLNQKILQGTRKKIERASEQGIVIGMPDTSFEVQKLFAPIGMILVHPKGREMLKDVIIAKVLPRLYGEKIILNTNIPEEVLKYAGLTEKQYVPPKEKQQKIIGDRKRRKGL